MTIDLTAEQEALIEKHLATGRYRSSAEVIADALHLLNDLTQLEEGKLARLRSEIQKGLASSEPEALDMASIIAEAETRHRQRSTR